MLNELQLNNASYGQPVGEAHGLVLEVTTESICFTEYDFEQKKPLFVCHYPLDKTSSKPLYESLTEAVTHFQFGKKNYSTVYVNYFSSLFTLCPVHFYDIQSARSVLEFNVGSINNDVLLTDDITSEIKVVYAIDELLKSSLDKLFPNHQLKHTQTILSKLMLQAEEFQKDDLLLCIHQQYIEVVYKKQNKLILTNQFSVKTEEDVLYYVLFIVEQYELNPLSLSLVITGNVDANSSVVKSIKKYIKYVRLATSHKTLNWQALYGSPQHFNYTLLNRLFCEL